MAGETLASLMVELGLDSKKVGTGTDEAKRHIQGMVDHANRTLSGSMHKVIDQTVGRVLGLGSAFASVGVAAAGMAGGMLLFSAGTKAFEFGKQATIGMNSSLETAELQFTKMMGSSAKAHAEVVSLFKFAKDTPFETQPVIQAARYMQLFGGDAFNTTKNLNLVGDAAAGTSADIKEVSFWTSRAYASIQGGRPFGEERMRLMELGIVTPQTSMKLEQMEKSGAGASEMWKVLSGDFSRFSGSMKDQAGTWQGLTSSVHDAVNILAAGAFKPFFDEMKKGMSDALGWLSKPEIEASANRIALNIKKDLGDAANFVKTDVLPKFREFNSWWDAEAKPRLSDFAGWVRSTGVPAVGEFGSAFLTAAKPAIGQLGDYLKSDFLPQLGQFVRWIGSDLLPVLGKWAAALATVYVWFHSHILPIVMVVAEAIGANLVRALGWLGDHSTIIISLLAVLAARMLAIKAIELTTTIANWISGFAQLAIRLGSTGQGNLMGAVTSILPAVKGFQGAMAGLGATLNISTLAAGGMVLGIAAIAIAAVALITDAGGVRTAIKNAFAPDIIDEFAAKMREGIGKQTIDDMKEFERSANGPKAALQAIGYAAQRAGRQDLEELAKKAQKTSGDMSRDFLKVVKAVDVKSYDELGKKILEVGLDYQKAAQSGQISWGQALKDMANDKWLNTWVTNNKKAFNDITTAHSSMVDQYLADEARRNQDALTTFNNAKQQFVSTYTEIGKQMGLTGDALTNFINQNTTVWQTAYMQAHPEVQKLISDLSNYGFDASLLPQVLSGQISITDAMLFTDLKNKLGAWGREIDAFKERLSFQANATVYVDVLGPGSTIAKGIRLSAEGSITTRPTLNITSENWEKEWVIPEHKTPPGLRPLLDSLVNGGGATGGTNVQRSSAPQRSGSARVDVHFHQVAPSQRAMERAIGKAMVSR